MKETSMMKRAQCGMVEDGAVLWRNNVGTFYQGDAETFKDVGMARLYPGDIVLRKSRRIKCGLDNGSSDLIGLVPLVVTPEMVGKNNRRVRERRGQGRARARRARPA